MTQSGRFLERFRAAGAPEALPVLPSDPADTDALRGYFEAALRLDPKFHARLLQLGNTGNARRDAHVISGQLDGEQQAKLMHDGMVLTARLQRKHVKGVLIWNNAGAVLLDGDGRNGFVPRILLLDEYLPVPDAPLLAWLQQQSVDLPPGLAYSFDRPGETDSAHQRLLWRQDGGAALERAYPDAHHFSLLRLAEHGVLFSRVSNSLYPCLAWPLPATSLPWPETDLFAEALVDEEALLEQQLEDLKADFEIELRRRRRGLVVLLGLVLGGLLLGLAARHLL